MTQRLTLVVGALAAVLSAAMGALSCIIADPPAELPKTPQERPHILSEAVVPPVTRVLTSWPTEFVVPVEVDPAATFSWNLFVDYDPFTNPDPQVFNTELPTTEGGIRMFTANPSPPSGGGCHIVEIVVALSFSGANPHEPVFPPGGDRAIWIYNPSGDLSGCATFDAGILGDGAFPDTMSDVTVVP